MYFEVKHVIKNIFQVTEQLNLTESLIFQLPRLIDYLILDCCFNS